MKVMKYISKIISITILMIGFSLTSCEKWTEVENKEIDHNGGANTLSPEERDAHYASLRAWKKLPKTTVAPCLSGGLVTGHPKVACAKAICLPCLIVSIWCQCGVAPLVSAKLKKPIKLMCKK